MAFTTSTLLNTISLLHLRSPCASFHPHRDTAFSAKRRLLLLTLTAGTVLKTTTEYEAMAEDIPMFGLRRKLKKAEELLSEGVETAEKEIETVVEKDMAAAEGGIGTMLGFGALEQAGAVLGVEALGIFVATSFVNSVLGPESRN